MVDKSKKCRVCGLDVIPDDGLCPICDAEIVVDTVAHLCRMGTVETSHPNGETK
jgi:RNA polymerase subunit RPABC4/transcription elongation factor Spt4